MGELNGRGVLAPVTATSKRLARRAVHWLTTAASDSYHGRWYYAQRWHPHETLQRRAHEDTVDYITEHMPDALIRRDADDVLRHACRLARIDGLHLEFGVRSGHTINLIARRLRKRTIHGFDSFEGLPEQWSGYSMDTGAFGGEGLPAVEPNVELHVGWFDDTLPAFLGRHAGPVAFVHVDSDIYSSARTILTELAPRFRPGSVIVFNEYFNYPNWRRHEFRAFQEFCEEYAVEYAYRCWGMYEVAVELTAIGNAATDEGTT